MTVELIREIVDYLDEDYNPVENESRARYVSTTTFDNQGARCRSDRGLQCVPNVFHRSKSMRRR